MVNHYSARARRVGLALNHFRLQAGMTLDQAAQEISSTKSTISRMEHGKALPRPAVIRALLMSYGVQGDELAALTELAKKANEPGWWRSYADVLPTPHVDNIALEAEATVISVFEPSSVPGLLQTPAYIRSVMRDGVHSLQDDEIERRVEARLERQKRLTDADAVQYCAILDEAVLRHPVGGRAVMGEQLAHVLKTAELRNVIVQVVPFCETAHPGLQGSVSVLEFADAEDPHIAVLETAAGDMILHKPYEVRDCEKIMNRLRSVALDPDASRTRIAATLEAEYQ